MSDNADRWRRLAFGLVACGLTLTLTVSANLLFVFGVDYAHPGGNPLVKLHPATWMIAGALLCLARAGCDFRADLSLVAFLALMTGTMLFSVASVGVSGATVYVESYLSAGMLALAMRQFGGAKNWALGLLVVGLLGLNAALALAETAGQFHLVPVYLEETALVDAPGEFRASALFDHPLTGAMLTMTGLLTLATPVGRGFGPAGRITLALLFALALLAFGGRAALGVTLLIGTARFVYSIGRDLYARRMTAARALGRLGTVVASCIALPLVAASGIGGRIADKLYLDASAQSRGAEWLVLGLLDTRAWLLGSPIAETPSLIYRIGLETALTDIENFWLLAFVNLGVVGFLPFMAAIFCLIGHLWRVAAPFGRVAVAALLVTASSSNSLGRKSNVLLVLVACVEAGAVTRSRSRSLGEAFGPVRRQVACAT